MINAYEKIVIKTENKLQKKNKRFNNKFVSHHIFDKNTMVALHHLLNSKIILYVNGLVKSGKESMLFWAIDKNGNDIALKIYSTTNSIFKKRNLYIPNKKQLPKFSNKHTIEMWAKHEFQNLKQCIKFHIPVTKPICVFKNILVMDFVGNNGIPNKTLAESHILQSDYDCFMIILHKLYKSAKLVHGDLSGFNIFKTNNGLLFFDLSSSLHITHPNADMLLKRDIYNMSVFFKNKGLVVQNPIDIYNSIKHDV